MRQVRRILALAVVVLVLGTACALAVGCASETASEPAPAPVATAPAPTEPVAVAPMVLLATGEIVLVAEPVLESRPLPWINPGMWPPDMPVFIWVGYPED